MPLAKCGQRCSLGTHPAPKLEGIIAVQVSRGASRLLCAGIRGAIAAMRGYQGRQKALLPWQDMFADLVQGRLQGLFLSLLAGEPFMVQAPMRVRHPDLGSVPVQLGGWTVWAAACHRMHSAPMPGGRLCYIWACWTAAALIYFHCWHLAQACAFWGASRLWQARRRARQKRRSQVRPAPGCLVKQPAIQESLHVLLQPTASSAMCQPVQAPFTVCTASTSPAPLLWGSIKALPPAQH